MSSLTRNLRRQRALIALAVCFIAAFGIAAAMLLNSAAPSAEPPASVDRVAPTQAPCTYRPQIRLASVRTLPVVREMEGTQSSEFRKAVCADTVPATGAV